MMQPSFVQELHECLDAKSCGDNMNEGNQRCLFTRVVPAMPFVRFLGTCANIALTTSHSKNNEPLQGGRMCAGTKLLASATKAKD